MKSFFLTCSFALLISCLQSHKADMECMFAQGLTDVDCGYVAVPAKRSEQNSGQIQIAYLVLKAKKQSTKDPIIFLQGGPGAPAISSMSVVFQNNTLRKDRDIVLVDQRGTGFSEAHCDELGSQFMAIMAQDLTAREEYNHILKIAQDCKYELSDQSIDLSSYTIAENAPDIEEVRKYLGYDKVVIMGGSYGTRLGLEYMKTYPMNVSASILLGLFPHHVSLYENIFTNLNASLRLVFKSCADNSECREAYPNLEERFYKIKTQLMAEPYAFKYNNGIFYMNAQDMLLLVHQMLYHPALIARIPEFVKAIEHKNPGPVRVSLQITESTMKLINGVMYWSVMSQEERPFVGAEAFQLDMEKNKHLMPGPAFFISDLKLQQEWMDQSVDKTFKLPVQSDIPTLLVNGGFDPVTPISNAESTLQYLSKGQLVKFPMNSHSLMNACFFELVRAFLRDPESPADGSCAQKSNGFNWE
ncbi:MAG: alpha/beta fold hydrolase [Bacteroidota bacterium]